MRHLFPNDSAAASRYLTGAQGYESNSTVRLQEQSAYAYDAAQNLNWRTNDALVQTFNVNALNQLTNVTRSGTLTVAGFTTAVATNVTVNGGEATRYADYTFARTNVSLTDGTNTFTAIAKSSSGWNATNTLNTYLPSTLNCSYDLNGNLLSDGLRGFAYDDENQLIRVTVSNAWRSEFVYDGKMRRRIRREFTWLSAIGNWQLTNEVHYVYDGNLVVQERGGNNNPVVNYTRGLDLSVSLEGAGGIGGLLAMTRQMPGLPPHYYYHSDGNGNVTMLINTQQLIVAKYLYEPFGNLIAANGPLADVNLYRFSSKEAHPNSGLVYYLYRFYEPTLQRWGNRDPLGELGGINLYGFVANNPVILIDAYGLAIVGMPTPVPPGDNSIVCKGGKPIIQNNNKGPDRKCTQAHEEQHLKDWKDRYGNDFCKGIKDGLLPTGGDGYSEFRRKSECMAFKVGKKCREDLLKSCNAKDKAAIQAGIDRDNKALKDNKCD